MDKNTDLERLLLLALHRIPGLGYAKWKVLYDHFGSNAAIWGAARRELEHVRGIGPETSLQIASARKGSRIERCRQELIDQGISAVTVLDRQFPAVLKSNLGDQVPLALYYRGALPTQPAIAVVGTRNPSRQGREEAAAFAAAFGREGITVVSGLARGIDGCAHHSAVAAGGTTAAVLATPLNDIYPRCHRQLAEQVGENGCLLTEMPLGSVVRRGSFPRRNRIIAGLSRGVLVVEAGLPSGALNTATWAAHMNLDVFAIPGSIRNSKRRGNHQLIQEGAALVETPSDVTELLGLRPASIQEDSDDCLEALVRAGLTAGQIIQRTGLPPQKVLRRISQLQLRDP